MSIVPCYVHYGWIFYSSVLHWKLVLNSTPARASHQIRFSLRTRRITYKYLNLERLVKLNIKLQTRPYSKTFVYGICAHTLKTSNQRICTHTLKTSNQNVIYPLVTTIWLVKFRCTKLILIYLNLLHVFLIWSIVLAWCLISQVKLFKA